MHVNGAMDKRGAKRPPKLPAAGQGTVGPVTKAGEPFPVHEHIGRQLKALFDEVANEPVPDKLVELLDELERKRAAPRDDE